MGGGKSSGSTQVQISPAQEAAIAAQTKFLTDTALPAYQKTLAGAGDVYGTTAPATMAAAQRATNVAQQTGNLQQGVGSASLLGGTAGLASLFDPQYEQNQIQGALQAGRESARESQAGQNAMYGAAGGLGSSRQALADVNMASLNAQRQATAAADAQAKVQANKAAAAQGLISAGQTGLGAANQAAGAQIGYAGAPQDLYSKYASVVFGTAQASTTPNFTGTQGQTTSGKSSGFKL